MRLSALLACTALVAPGLASGGALASPTAEEARALHAHITELLQASVQQLGPEVALPSLAKLSVEVAGDGYDVLLPAGPLILDEDVQFNFGDLPMRMVPEGDGHFRTSWDLPSPIEVVEDYPGFQDTIRIHFTQDAGSGIYVPDFWSFLEMDARLVDIVVESDEGPTDELRAALLELVSSSVDLGDGRYDGRSSGRLSGLYFREDGEELFWLGEASFEATFTDADLSGLGALQRELAMLLSDEDRALGADGEPISRFQLLAEMLEDVSYLLDGAEIAYGVNDFRFQDPLWGENYSLGHARISGGILGLSGETSTITVNIASSDLVVAEVPPAFSPNLLDVTLALVDLPNAELMELATDGLVVAAQAGPDLAMTMLPFQLLEVIMSSDSRLELSPSRLLLGELDVALEGTVQPSAESIVGVVADVRMEIAGMAETIALMQTEGLNDPDILMVLTLIQSLGDQRTRDDGRAIRAYDVQVLPNGTVLLNDTDLMPLIEGIL